VKLFDGNKIMKIVQELQRSEVQGAIYESKSENKVPYFIATE
jgi:hypothetical protein